MNILPQSIHALRDVLDGVPGTFMHNRTGHQRAATEMLGCTERSTHPINDAVASRAATSFGLADNSVLIAIPASRRGMPPIQSP
jgi:hypothetical protein